MVKLHCLELREVSFVLAASRKVVEQVAPRYSGVHDVFNQDMLVNPHGCCVACMPVS